MEQEFNELEGNEIIDDFNATKNTSRTKDKFKTKNVIETAVKEKKISKSAKKNQKVLQCTICLKEFKRKDHWKNHLLTHGSIKNNACPYCDYRVGHIDMYLSKEISNKNGHFEIDRKGLDIAIFCQYPFLVISNGEIAKYSNLLFLEQLRYDFHIRMIPPWQSFVMVQHNGPQYTISGFCLICTVEI